MSHTPGPWEVYGNSDEGLSVRSSAIPGAVCFMAWIFQDTKGEGEANARLIAAAPDLLAALKALLTAPEIADCDPNDKDEETNAIERLARATIAKAEGTGP